MFRPSRLLRANFIAHITKPKSSKITNSAITTTTSTTPPTRLFHTTARTMVVHNIGSKDNLETALAQNEVVILDAYATWCGPCKMIAPKLVEFSETHTKAHFVKLDVDEVPDVAQELQIRAMPTFVIFKNGKVLNRVVGANATTLADAIVAAVDAE